MLKAAKQKTKNPESWSGSYFSLGFLERKTHWRLYCCFTCKQCDCCNMLIVLVVVSRIQRYAVIPLSTNSGLLGWVPHSDTLHTLIRDYREKKKILLNIEHRIMLRVSLCYGWKNLPIFLTQRSKRKEKT